jgi:hypothetical protein
LFCNHGFPFHMSYLDKMSTPGQAWHLHFRQSHSHLSRRCSRVDPLVARYLPPRGETPLLSSYDRPPNSVALKSALKGTRPRTAHAASRRVHTPDPMQQQLQHGLHDAAGYTHRASKTPPRSCSSPPPSNFSHAHTAFAFAFAFADKHTRTHAHV